MALRHVMAKKYRSVIIVAQSIIIALLLCILAIPHFSGRKSKSYPDVEHKLIRRDVRPLDVHPFENDCNFPILEDEDLSLKSTIRHRKDSSCPLKYPLQVVHRYIDGSFLINSSLSDASFSCSVQVLSGAMRPHAGIAMMSEPTQLPVDSHFTVNEDNFLISCSDGKNGSGHELFSRAYMGVKMADNNELILDAVVSDTTVSSRPLRVDSMSIAILVFDSTSRSQFARHMPKSRQLMAEMGSVTLLGYNKVGDNSAPNLSPILAEPYKENEDYDLLDTTGDIALNKFLPSRKKIHPDTIDFIWKKMEKKGCETFFNDDVMHTSRGLFHYTDKHFFNGFKIKPTDHYYRPYYAHLYKKLRNLWKLCWDGRLMSEEFMMPWFIALQRLANKCFFSFNFLTSPSHDNPNNLESVDDGLYTRLQALNNSGSLSNTMLIIMGDHGQRMHFSQMKFAGRIEERQPLMSMLFPKGFKERYQTEFENLLTNVNRLTSNVDIHETLLDIIDNRFGKTRPEGRGRSLFTPIPTSRTCTEAWIPKNFCLCQYKVTKEEREKYNQTSDALVSALRDHLRAYSCLNANSLSCSENHTLFQPHQAVRMGMRTKANWTEKMARTIPPKAFFAQTHCEISTSSDFLITLLVRSRVDLAGLKHSIAYSPMIVKAEGKCANVKNLATICSCLNEERS